jgi:hypothetical protein
MAEEKIATQGPYAALPQDTKTRGLTIIYIFLCLGAVVAIFSGLSRLGFYELL